MSTIRLDRLLSNLGYCSRKEAVKLASQGRIALMGAAIFKGDHVITREEAANGSLTLDGVTLDPPSPLTVMLNKPAGYNCSRSEQGKLVYDLLPPRWKRRTPILSTVGRLDKESTGQLLLTDDGELLHRIIHPKSHALKYYAVTLAAPLKGNEKLLFSSGDFMLPDDPKPLKPAQWKASGDSHGIMCLSEGRYHQIRRMFEVLGNRVIALHRMQTGGLLLGNLQPAHYRIVHAEDIDLLFQ